MKTIRIDVDGAVVRVTLARSDYLRRLRGGGRIGRVRAGLLCFVGLGLFAAALAAQEVVVPGQGAPAVTIPRLDGAVTIDGVPDEPQWGQAARLTGFSQYLPVDGRPAESPTEVRVWYSPEAIYFGVIASDPDPGSIRATVAERDNLDRDDSVTIYLDTFNDRRRAFFFQVNPLGMQQDGVQNEGQETAGSLFGGSADTSPDYVFQSKGRVTGEGYCVEIRIPFRSLRYPGSDPQQWGLNIRRKTQRTGYEDTWTDVRRGSASFLAQSGTLVGMHDLVRGLVTEVQPFTTLVSAGERDGVEGGFARQAARAHPGINAHFGLTNVSIDATVKPDFSQVESDAGLVTLNERFALFYPEKRPFFLEGIELFSTPSQLVYTRQIGSPIAGGKFTGKIGRYGIGYLLARDQGDAEDATFQVARLRRDLGKDSLAGITFTDRSAASGFNRVAAADVRWVFAKLYFIEGQVGRSWTRADGVVRSSPIWEVQFDRTGRSWGFNYRLGGIGPSFQTRAGFVPRNNIVQGWAFNRLSWYGQRGARFENISTHMIFSRLWPYVGSVAPGAIEGTDSVELQVQMRGGWTVGSHLSNSFFRFDPDGYAGYAVQGIGGAPFRPPLGMSGALEVEAELQTPVYRRFQAGAWILRRETPIFAEASEGLETQAGANLALRPSDSVRIEGSAVFSHLVRRQDRELFARTFLPRVKLEYQPRRSLFFRVVGEYRTEQQAALEDPQSGAALFIDGVPAAATRQRGLRLDWLISYEPTPGTSFFAGYGTTLDEAAGRFDRAADGFFVKVAYTFRR